MTDADEPRPDPEDHELDVPGLPEDDEGDHPFTEDSGPIPI